MDLVRLFKDRPRPGLQLPDQGLRPAHLLHVDGQLGGDGPVVPLGQGVQVVLDDGQGGAGLMDAAQLELQALGQVSRPHPRGLQGAQQLDAPLDFLHGDRQVPGQVLRAGAQIAVPVQAGGQVAHRLGGILVQLHGVELAGEEAEQGLLQPLLSAGLSQGVQLLLLHVLVVAVLMVVVLQPAQPAQKLLVLGAVCLRPAVVQLDDRVLLGQLPEVRLHLQRAHLQQLHALQLLLV